MLIPYIPAMEPVAPLSFNRGPYERDDWTTRLKAGLSIPKYGWSGRVSARQARVRETTFDAIGQPETLGVRFGPKAEAPGHCDEIR